LFEIVAHRGCPDTAPENTLPAFLRAIELGADSVELDVRLTSDGVLVVYHYFYMDKITNLSGPIFSHTWDEVRRARFSAAKDVDVRIPLLEQVLDALAGRIGLEIEIKGPESESVDVVVAVLKNHPGAKRIEVTSYEPMLLRAFQRRMPGIPTDLLIPRSEAWMGRDVVAYSALQRGRMAGARAVHIHPSQIDRETVELIRQAGLEVHAWDVNDRAALQLVAEFQIPRLDTDQLQQAINFREGKQYDRPI
jgi:glycerophosphoryl diester phosphodiesterase